MSIEAINEQMSNMTELGNKYRRIDILNQLNIGLDITADVLSKINLYLIPVKIEGKFGFIDKDANHVIKTLYDKYMDAFDNEHSLIRISIDGKWGVINAKGQVIIPTVYSEILISDNQQLFTVKKDYKAGVLDLDQNVIVDFGEYSYIDGYDSGLARVKIKDKWGIIDTMGEVVLSVEFDNIWNFYKKNRTNTSVEKNGVRSSVHFNNLYRLNDCSVRRNTPTCYSNDDYQRSVYDYPEYDDSLDMDQQSIEFWNNF
ncbi:MAG: WG repeat-containing protein [Bacteroidales bacterium]